MQENYSEDRRVGDRRDVSHICPVSKAEIRGMEQRLHDLEIKALEVSKAFILNDLKIPDYDGHRKDHIKTAKHEEILDNYKISATKDIIKLIATFLLGALAVGIMEYVRKGGV